MARMELNEENLANVVGGAFNWYSEDDGSSYCKVDGVGTYKVTPSAQSRWMMLMLQHKLDGWTAADFVDVLVSEGYFS